MTFLLSTALVIVVAILGFVLLPMVSLVVLLPIQMIVGLVNKRLGYMASRYSSLAFDVAVLLLLITWAGDRFALVTWPAWLVAGLAMFMAGNTLIFFDIRCYLSDGGAWAKPSDITEADFTGVQ
ncbi:MAG TPA: hypothetical protein VIN40_03845 [Candidatus Tyrphobacter sp.]